MFRAICHELLFHKSILCRFLLLILVKILLILGNDVSFVSIFALLDLDVESILKFLEYNQGLSLNFGFSRHNISIDFEKKIMEGCINKNMTNKDIEIVFELLEKYHIYQLNSGKYWKKLTYHSSSCFDGYEWSLYLVFERDKYLRIFNGNDYPDIFTYLAQEIIDLTGKDILNVNSIDEKDFKL